MKKKEEEEGEEEGGGRRRRKKKEEEEEEGERRKKGERKEKGERGERKEGERRKWECCSAGRRVPDSRLIAGERSCSGASLSRRHSYCTPQQQQQPQAQWGRDEREWRSAQPGLRLLPGCLLLPTLLCGIDMDRRLEPPELADECVEMATSGQQNNIEMVIIRGNNIIILEALE
ncbi:Small nuclear ribonucleoprotein G [Myotis davidii]|uniref:Small nuclear ribonucleoprotein G n=1 Tax=Myotis davidii TaxID=225400 RepID=L5MBG7_MYODS|nr:Small nuclear ribonucleoprotein G [Myotis davidii]